MVITSLVIYIPSQAAFTRKKANPDCSFLVNKQITWSKIQVPWSFSKLSVFSRAITVTVMEHRKGRTEGGERATFELTFAAIYFFSFSPIDPHIFNLHVTPSPSRVQGTGYCGILRERAKTALGITCNGFWVSTTQWYILKYFKRKSDSLNENCGVEIQTRNIADIANKEMILDKARRRIN